MKILIIPYYLYTHFEAFKSIANKLESTKNTVLFYNIRGENVIDKCNEEYLNQIPSRKLVQPKTIALGTKTGLLHRSIRFLKYLYNFYVIKGSLNMVAPDLVILGSDSGGIYIRKIQEILKTSNIPIVILQVVMFSPTTERKELKINYSVFTKKVFDMLGIKKVFTYIGDIPGMYLHTNIVFSLGKTSKKVIESFGKEPSLIYEIGNPANDNIKIAMGNNSCTHNQISLKFDSNQQYIIYFTEMIHEVYGEIYFDKLNLFLKIIFDRLPENIHIVIKPHPRENDCITDKLLKLFSGNRYHFIYNVDNIYLINSSLLSIAHNSTVLFNAILLEKAILSINFIKPKIFFQFPESVIVRNKDELQNFISQFITDKEFTNKILKDLSEWKDNNIYCSDSFNSTDMAVQEILHIIKMQQ